MLGVGIILIGRGILFSLEVSEDLLAAAPQDLSDVLRRVNDPAGRHTLLSFADVAEEVREERYRLAALATSGDFVLCRQNGWIERAGTLSGFLSFGRGRDDAALEFGMLRPLQEVERLGSNLLAHRLEEMRNRCGLVYERVPCPQVLASGRSVR